LSAETALHAPHLPFAIAVGMGSVGLEAAILHPRDTGSEFKTSEKFRCL
jgi:hypothetical protein